MKKFAVYLEYFKKYAAEYKFDYLIIVALGHQESQLDQSKRSRNGAVEIMQVIPKYAAAKPINVPDVSIADKNILAGVRILNNIERNYFLDPSIDRVNKTLFTFAAYNAGLCKGGASLILPFRFCATAGRGRFTRTVIPTVPKMCLPCVDPMK